VYIVNSWEAKMEDNHQVALVIVLGICFLPGIIASTRSHNNILAISVLNLCMVVIAVFSMLMGVMGTLLIALAALGWIIALVWACTNNVRSNVGPVIIEQPRNYQPPMPRFWQSVSPGSKAHES
jgi:hypothetical protein